MDIGTRQRCSRGGGVGVDGGAGLVVESLYQCWRSRSRGGGVGGAEGGWVSHCITLSVPGKGVAEEAALDGAGDGWVGHCITLGHQCCRWRVEVFIERLQRLD